MRLEKTSFLLDVGKGLWKKIKYISMAFWRENGIFMHNVRHIIIISVVQWVTIAIRPSGFWNTLFRSTTGGGDIAVKIKLNQNDNCIFFSIITLCNPWLHQICLLLINYKSIFWNHPCTQYLRHRYIKEDPE